MPTLTPEATAAIYEAFRLGNPNYAARLPKVTISNVLAVGGMIADNTPMFNDFIQVLDKVANTYINSPKFENPLAENKREVSQYGGLLEDIFVGLVPERVFRSIESGKDLFGAERPNVKAAYYSVNRRVRYKVTISDVDIKKAMRTEGGLSNIVNMLIESMSTSNEIDEYGYMKALIDGAYAKGEMYYVEVGDITTPEGQKKFVEKAREYSALIRFLNDWNAAGVMNTSKISSMALYKSALTSSKIDVNVLSAAFNLDKADFNGQQVQLDRFSDPNMYAAFLDKSFFVVADYLREMRSQPDAVALKTNHFLHVHQYIARSPFATAIAFVKEIPAGTPARLILDPPVGILGSTALGEEGKALKIFPRLSGFDGSTVDLSVFTITAVPDYEKVTATVDAETNAVTLSVSDDAAPGKVVSVLFTATYDTDKTVTARGTYTVSQFIGQTYDG